MSLSPFSYFFLPSPLFSTTIIKYNIFNICKHKNNINYSRCRILIYFYSAKTAVQYDFSYMISLSALE